MHLVMLVCTLDPSPLKFKVIIRSWRWWWERYQLFGMTRKAVCKAGLAASVTKYPFNITRIHIKLRDLERMGASRGSDLGGNLLTLLSVAS